MLALTQMNQNNNNQGAMQVYGTGGTQDVRSNMKRQATNESQKVEKGYMNTLDNSGSSLPVIGKQQQMQLPTLP